MEEAVRRIREVEGKKERRREGQIREAKRRREEKRRGTGGGAGGDPAVAPEERPDETQAEEEDAEPDSKRSKPTAADSSASTPAPQGRRPRSEREFTMKTGAYARGHTSFLTFAVLLPQEHASREEEAEGKEREKKDMVEKREDGQGEGEKRMEEE